MRFDVLTLFPSLFDSFRTEGVLGRAVDKGLLDVRAHDLRQWSDNRWQQIDDEPYGGCAGMVIKAPPVIAAVRELQSRPEPAARAIVLSPRGRVFDQESARKMALETRLLLVCGRYEGFDERALALLGLEELSIGDFVLGGGEVAAMAVIETVARLVPGVVGDPRSVELDSFTEGLLDYPCYTRPVAVEGLNAPPVLLSGHHERIRYWRLEESVRATVTRRPDLVKKSWDRFSPEVRALVRRFAPELAAECAAQETKDV